MTNSPLRFDTTRGRPAKHCVSCGSVFFPAFGSRTRSVTICGSWDKMRGPWRSSPDVDAGNLLCGWLRILVCSYTKGQWFTRLESSTCRSTTTSMAWSIVARAAGPNWSQGAYYVIARDRTVQRGTLTWGPTKLEISCRLQRGPTIARSTVPYRSRSSDRRKAAEEGATTGARNGPWKC